MITLGGRLPLPLPRLADHGLALRADPGHAILYYSILYRIVYDII